MNHEVTLVTVARSPSKAVTSNQVKLIPTNSITSVSILHHVDCNSYAVGNERSKKDQATTDVFDGHQNKLKDPASLSKAPKSGRIVSERKLPTRNVPEGKVPTRNVPEGKVERHRLVQKGGHSNVSKRTRRTRRCLSDLFTTLVELKWPWHAVLFSSAFLLSWLLFALLWLATVPRGVRAIKHNALNNLFKLS